MTSFTLMVSPTFRGFSDASFVRKNLPSSGELISFVPLLEETGACCATGCCATTAAGDVPETAAPPSPFCGYEILTTYSSLSTLTIRVFG